MKKILLLAVYLHSASAFAGTEQLNGESEYLQATPYLNKFSQLIKEVDKRLTSGKSPKDSFSPYLDDIRLNAEKAATLLNQASHKNHPVAQYRLAQIIDYLGSNEEKLEICNLLKKSLYQGFPPAALEAATLCSGFVNTPEFLIYAEESARSTRYSDYFPQPSHFLSYCERPRKRTLIPQEGSEEEYQAAIFYLLGSKNEKPISGQYYKLAAEKGCSRANTRL